MEIQWPLLCQVVRMRQEEYFEMLRTLTGQLVVKENWTIDFQNLLHQQYLQSQRTESG